MPQTHGYFFVSSDTELTVVGIHNPQGQFINNALISGVLKTLNDQAVSGIGTITFSYVPESDGDYTGTLPNTAVLQEKTEYELWLTVAAAGKIASIKVRRLAKQLSL